MDEHEHTAADDYRRAGHDAYPQTYVALIAGSGRSADFEILLLGHAGGEVHLYAVSPGRAVPEEGVCDRDDSITVCVLFDRVVARAYKVGAVGVIYVQAAVDSPGLDQLVIIAVGVYCESAVGVLLEICAPISIRIYRNN